MTPFELKQLRRETGASLSQMADLLGLSGEGAADAVRKMENGAKPISGPIERLACYMQQGIGEGELAALPPFLICAPLTGEAEPEIVFHTRYPRFLAAVSDRPIDWLNCASGDQVEWLAVFMWIDYPLSDPQPLVQQAAELFHAYSLDSSRAANDE